MIQPIYPCLWFDANAKEAAEYYRTVFPNSAITGESPVVINFESSGQRFIFINGGPMFKINSSISIFVLCESEMEVDQKFTPTLMFAGDQNGMAREAIGFYTSVFKDSDIKGILEYGKDDEDVEGNVKHAQFNLGKTVFMAMDSSIPDPPAFNEGFSFVVECANQAEIDYYWDMFTREGEESMCGWCRDQYGVWWQILPAILNDLMNDPDRSERVTQAFLKMKKFDIETLLKA